MVKSHVLAVVAAVSLAFAASAGASVYSGTNGFPPPGVYKSSAPVAFTGTNIEMTSWSWGAVNPGSVDPSQFPLTSFFDIWYDVTLTDTSTGIASLYHSTTQVQFSVQATANPNVFDTQLSSLDMQLAPGLEIRQSLTMPSLGETTVTPNPTGGYDNDFWSNVWVEMTIDGKPWVPAPTPVNVNAVPLPLASFAGLGLLAPLALRKIVRRRGA